MYCRTSLFTSCGWIFAFSVFLVSGCSDSPTGAGLDLVGKQAGEPVIVRLAPLVFASGSRADVTGGDSFLSPGDPGASRVLAGNVQDPALGTIDVRGNLDFLPLTQSSDNFKSSTISWARLTLRINYVYGDTLTPVTFQLHDILDEWNAIGARADTVLDVGDVILEKTIGPKDADLTIDLPPAWLAQHDSELRDASVRTAFHGFQLVASQGNAVIGFQITGSTLRAAVPGDTITLQMTQMLTQVRKESIPQPGSNVLIQDGASARVDLNFDLEREDLSGNAVHRVVLSLQSTMPTLDTPVDFVRPTLSLLNLNIVEGEAETRTTIATVAVSPEGTFTIDDSDLNTVVQNVVLGIGTLKRLELVPPPESNTLNILFLSGDTADVAPYLELTMTPVN